MSINKENVKDIKLIDKIIDGTQNVAYDNSISGLTSTTIKGAIDELASHPATVDTFTFDTSYVQTGNEPTGTLSWNQTDETLDLVVGGGTIYQIGQEQGVVARNLSGSTLVNGSIVRVTGASGDKITIDLADNTTEPTSSATFAVCTQTIPNNSTGKITTSGLVRGLNTSSLTEGIAVWLDGAGQFTAVKPQAPDHLVHVGWVVRSHATEGMILVKISNGWELNELHDVLITNISDGQLIQWNSTLSVWENKLLTDMPIFTSYVSGAVALAKQQAVDDALALAIALG